MTIGVGLGLVAAVAASRTMRGLLFGVAPHDPATYAAVLAVVVTAVAVAAYVPARHVTRVDPQALLRGGSTPRAVSLPDAQQLKPKAESPKPEA